MTEPRIIAIDWSGRRGPDQKGHLAWRGNGWRVGTTGEWENTLGDRELLIAEAQRDPNVVVDFDFAFSLPCLVPSRRGAYSADAVGDPRSGVIDANDADRWTRELDECTGAAVLDGG